MRDIYWTLDLGLMVAVLAIVWAYSWFRRTREIELRFDAGYSPAAITVRQGEAVRLRLVRETASRCAQEIVFPSLNIRRTLPIGQPVTIDVRPRHAGVIEFFCGMNMLRGTLEVRPQI